MRCSARRRRAAATISIARVILRMFCTLAMRFWTSRWLDMAAAAALGGLVLRFVLVLGLVLVRGLILCGCLVPPAAADVAVGVVLLQRLALLVEVVAEIGRIVGDQRVHGLLGLVRPVAAADLLQELAGLRARTLGQTSEELGNPIDRDAVEVAAHPGEDLDDLVLDGQGGALVLVQRGHEPLAAGQRALGL